jgi:hypothetical protein
VQHIRRCLPCNRPAPHDAGPDATQPPRTTTPRQEPATEPAFLTLGPPRSTSVPNYRCLVKSARRSTTSQTACFCASGARIPALVSERVHEGRTQQTLSAARSARMRRCRKWIPKRRELPSTLPRATKSPAFQIGGGARERKRRFELPTLSLARRCSTTEPLPRAWGIALSEDHDTALTTDVSNSVPTAFGWWQHGASSEGEPAARRRLVIGAPTTAQSHGGDRPAARRLLIYCRRSDQGASRAATLLVAPCHMLAPPHV